MSPRAAARLESLGLEQVHDYAAGKADWGSAGLPLEGRNGTETRAGAHLRADVPTCRLDDRLQDVCERLDQSSWDTCFVVDDQRDRKSTRLNSSHPSISYAVFCLKKKKKKKNVCLLLKKKTKKLKK